MAQPIQPFAGGGGYGNIMAPGYLDIASQVANQVTEERNRRGDAAFNAVGGALGGLIGMNPTEVNALFPSALNQYYAQASELDKKSSAAKKMLELNPELFGLNQEQAKQLGDVTGKMSSTERYDFFQQYVPTLFKAQQARLEQEAAANKALAGREPVPDLSGAAAGLRSVIGGNQPTPVSPQPAPGVAPSAAPEPQTKGLQVPRTPQFDPTSGADILNRDMSDKYGPDWRRKGIKASDADVKAIGF